MLRILIFILVVAALVAGSVWLADRPGEVVVVWQGWRVDTNVPVLLLALVVLAAAVLTGLKLLTGLIHAPGNMAARRRETKRAQGYSALTDGLAAVAAGDTGQAKKLAKKADSLLNHAPVTTLLSAQAAEMSGQRDNARAHFEALLNRPETTFVGLRGLTTLALKDGDKAKALDYAVKAYEVNPEAEGLAAIVADLQIQAGKWREADEVLETALRKGRINPAEGKHLRAIVLHERAARAMTDGDDRAAVKFEEQAHALDPALIPVTARLAEWYAKSGRQRKAATVIEAGWAQAPHPVLRQSYFALWPKAAPLEKVKKAEHLARFKLDDVESHMAIAEAALDAKLWGQARNHLLKAAELRPSVETYRLLARLEEQESGDKAAAQTWLAKAAEAPAEATWHCGSCGATPAEWNSVCPQCGAFDALAWDNMAPKAGLPAKSA